MRSLSLSLLFTVALFAVPKVATAQGEGSEVVWTEREMPARPDITAWRKEAYCPSGKVAIAGGWETGALGTVIQNLPVLSTVDSGQSAMFPLEEEAIEEEVIE